RTEKSAGIAVSDDILGRVVNALGAPIDGGPSIKGGDYRPIEYKAPGVIARKEVNVPLQTGILAIDSMFPIGRGQRELIIGDRQTGKTALAVDAILNQKGQDVICIYVAIGQKASTVAQIVNTLKQHGAMDYSVVVVATAADSATLQYIAPYSGAAIGEHFMDSGKDVLIIYDDLSKHAQAYRAISLLLKRPPGREAYPGDVFYLHSRLLERACRRSEEYGGGAMTARPIIDTQAGDVSSYIPTYVISITDGQIFLETELFHSGQRPAVNVGLSVSRVGGKAQTKAMKSASGTLRIDLAQYREMESFTQFSSDLDDATRATLEYGRGLYQLLKQPLYHPMSMAHQVVLLVAAAARQLVGMSDDQIAAFKQEILPFLEERFPEILNELNNTGRLSDKLRERIVDAVKQYKSR
ncbi:MAG: F0F1 ATP synthase subunit alpha, partial [Oscillospiraceae bacterium]|nr:F0F1 ATP synthase subunit alpha [Oscillospiraceae bacterium]